MERILIAFARPLEEKNWREGNYQIVAKCGLPVLEDLSDPLAVLRRFFPKYVNPRHLKAQYVQLICGGERLVRVVLSAFSNTSAFWIFVVKAEAQHPAFRQAVRLATEAPYAKVPEDFCYP